MNEKATIFDYARMCNAHSDCGICPIQGMSLCVRYSRGVGDIDKANEIILNWSKAHPVKTRQNEFLKMFPNAKIDNCGTSILCPRWVDKDFKCNRQLLCCAECCKEYWLAEVEENE